MEVLGCVSGPPECVKALVISGGSPYLLAGRSVEVFLPSAGSHCLLPNMTGSPRYYHSLEFSLVYSVMCTVYCVQVLPHHGGAHRVRGQRLHRHQQALPGPDRSGLGQHLLPAGVERFPHQLGLSPRTAPARRRAQPEVY